MNNQLEQIKENIGIVVSCGNQNDSLQDFLSGHIAGQIGRCSTAGGIDPLDILAGEISKLNAKMRVLQGIHRAITGKEYKGV